MSKFWHERRPKSLEEVCDDIGRLVQWLRCAEDKIDKLGLVINSYAAHGNSKDGWYILKFKSDKKFVVLYCAGGMLFSNNDFTKPNHKVNSCQNISINDKIIETFHGPLKNKPSDDIIDKLNTENNLEN